MQWALTVRVIPMNLDNVKDNELFVELIALDVLERMRSGRRGRAVWACRCSSGIGVTEIARW